MRRSMKSWLVLCAVGAAAACGPVDVAVTPTSTPKPKKTTGASSKPGDATPTPAATGATARPTGTPTIRPTTAATTAATTGPTTAPTASPTASPTVAPTASPTSAATTIPTTLPTATATIAVSAPPANFPLTIISGTVYDEEGATVDDAQIRIESLDSSVPYTATATTSSGSWVVNNAPQGVNLSIVATKEGWTSRRRLGSFQNSQGANRVDFGLGFGDAGNGPAFFISDYPEIAQVEPAAGTSNVDGTSGVVVKLTFSEALTDDSRDNVEEAFRLFPIGGYDPTIDEDAGFPAPEVDIDSLVSGAISTGAGNVAWSTDGLEMTFTYGVALEPDTEYAVVLVGAELELEDVDGNQLGTDANGTLGATPSAERLVRAVFKEVDLGVEAISGVSGADAAWQATHDDAITFRTAP